MATNKIIQFRDFLKILSLACDMDDVNSQQLSVAYNTIWTDVNNNNGQDITEILLECWIIGVYKQTIIVNSQIENLIYNAYITNPINLYINNWATNYITILRNSTNKLQNNYNFKYKFINHRSKLFDLLDNNNKIGLYNELKISNIDYKLKVLLNTDITFDQQKYDALKDIIRDQILHIADSTKCANSEKINCSEFLINPKNNVKIDSEKIYRKMDNDIAKYYHIDNNNEVPFPDRKQDFQRLVGDFNKELNFISHCISSSGSNPRKCIKSLDSFNISDVNDIKQLVMNMHPSLMLKVLKTLGMKKIRVYDENLKRNIYKIQDLCEFLNNSEDCEDLQGNVLILIHFIICRVHANPGILNEGFSPEDLKRIANQTSLSYLSNFGLGKSLNYLNSTLADRKQQHINLLNLLNSNKDSNSQNLNMAIPYTLYMSGVTSVPLGFRQSGGSYSSSYDNMIHSGSNQLQGVINRLIQTLKSKNIILSQGAEDSLNKAVTDLQQHEKTAWERAVILEKLDKVQDLARPGDFISESRLKHLMSKGERSFMRKNESTEKLMELIRDLFTQHLSSTHSFDELLEPLP